MGLSYYYTFSASKTVPAAELERFLKVVEKKTQDLGFNPTFVLNGPFASDEQKQFVRRITSGLLVDDPRLKGVTLFDTSKVWDYDPESGRCRSATQKAAFHTHELKRNWPSPSMWGLALQSASRY